MNSNRRNTGRSKDEATNLPSSLSFSLPFFSFFPFFLSFLLSLFLPFFGWISPPNCLPHSHFLSLYGLDTWHLSCHVSLTWHLSCHLSPTWHNYPHDIIIHMACVLWHVSPLTFSHHLILLMHAFNHDTLPSLCQVSPCYVSHGICHHAMCHMTPIISKNEKFRLS